MPPRSRAADTSPARLLRLAAVAMLAVPAGLTLPTASRGSEPPLAAAAPPPLVRDLPPPARTEPGPPVPAPAWIRPPRRPALERRSHPVGRAPRPAPGCCWQGPFCRPCACCRAPSLYPFEIARQDALSLRLREAVASEDADAPLQVLVLTSRDGGRTWTVAPVESAAIAGRAAGSTPDADAEPRPAPAAGP